MSSNQGVDHTTATRERIYAFIVAYKQAHDGIAPTLREIAEACHIVLSGVHYHLSRLESEQRVRFSDSRSRTIEIVGGIWQPPEGDRADGEDPATRDGEDRAS
jgi:SOS-response transcriptional repressor LexA